MYDIEELKKEFLPDNLNDTETNYQLKNYVFNRLTEPERKVLLLYAEYSSLKKVAKILNVSHQSISNYLKKIREKIKNDNGYSN